MNHYHAICIIKGRNIIRVCNNINFTCIDIPFNTIDIPSYSCNIPLYPAEHQYEDTIHNYGSHFPVIIDIPWYPMDTNCTDHEIWLWWLCYTVYIYICVCVYVYMYIYIYIYIYMCVYVCVPLYWHILAGRPIGNIGVEKSRYLPPSLSLSLSLSPWPSQGV